MDGPLGDRYADLEQTAIFHGIGLSREQAAWVIKQARTLLLMTAVTVDGRRTLYINCRPASPVQRDEDVQPPLFYAVDEYTFATTPA
jgi:hypothetical protein